MLRPATTAEWDWQLKAACRGLDGTWFFPPEHEQAKARRSRIAKAKTICVQCPVLIICRNFALDNGEVYGVWGGLSEEDRAKVFIAAATG